MSLTRDTESDRRQARPTPEDLAAAAGLTIPDVLPAPGERFDVLFCGINPGLYSAATGWHFARPGNRFWPALHRSGFTPRLLLPAEQDQLPALGLGITNLVARATARAAELSDGELRAGAVRLTKLTVSSGPLLVALAGVSAYRVAFGRRDAAVGPTADRIGPARVWVLPNPSGLNARWTPAAIAAELARMRDSIGVGRQG